MALARRLASRQRHHGQPTNNPDQAAIKRRFVAEEIGKFQRSSRRIMLLKVGPEHVQDSDPDRDHAVALTPEN